MYLFVLGLAIGAGMIWIATEVRRAWPLPAGWFGFLVCLEIVFERGVRVDSVGLTLLRRVGSRPVRWEDIGEVAIDERRAYAVAAEVLASLVGGAAGGHVGASAGKWIARGGAVLTADAPPSRTWTFEKHLSQLAHRSTASVPMITVRRRNGREAFFVGGSIDWKFAQTVAAEAHRRGVPVRLP